MKRIIEFWTFAILLGLCSPGASSLMAAEKVDLKVGDSAPTFEAQDDSGNTWKSADHVGKKIVVVYFYPADCTGGCTKQAKGFTKDQQALADKGVEVVGVSGDSVDNHKIFKKKEKLSITLLADENGELAAKFGVPVGKGGEITTDFEGTKVPLKQGVRAKRWTFVIGKDGKILHKDTAVKPDQDSQAVLKLLSKES